MTPFPGHGGRSWPLLGWHLVARIFGTRTYVKVRS